MSIAIKNDEKSFDSENPPKNGVASKIRWARPDLVFNDGLATPIFDEITLLQEFVNGFEHLNEDLMLDEEPDVYVLSKR